MIVSNKICLWLGISSIAVLGIGESTLAQSDRAFNHASSSLTTAEYDLRSLDSSKAIFSNIAQGEPVDEPFPSEVEVEETEVEVEPDASEVEIEEPETDEGILDELFTTGQNYLGVGGSFGLVEDAYGDFGAFAAISKLKLFTLTESNDVSIRPSVLVGEDVTFVVPFTLDINLGDVESAEILGRRFVPYGGPGFTFTTDTDVFYFTLTGGLDIPFEQFTINTEVNVGFLDDIALGVILGIGYNF